MVEKIFFKSGYLKFVECKNTFILFFEINENEKIKIITRKIIKYIIKT